MKMLPETRAARQAVRNPLGVARAPRALATALGLSAVLAAGCGSGSGGSATGGNDTGAPPTIGGGNGRDDIKGRWHNFNVNPLHAFEFEADDSGFFTLNSPGSRLVRFSLPDLETTLDVPTGPGLTSVRARRGTSELWCVDSLTSVITVVDRETGSITHSIPVGAEPQDLVFTSSGDRAYVTCSQAGRVDVVDAASYSVAASIPIPARLPRAIERIGSRVFVVPQRSGNGSAPRGNPLTGRSDDVRTVEHVGDVPGAVALPDEDLFVIQITGSPATDALDPSATVSGLGTILFNVRARPGDNELWIPHTDALNVERRGEANFVDGQVVRNRVAIVDAASGDVRTIDLDELAPAPDVRVGTPTAVAFNHDGTRAFVCGYGSSRVAVLDLAGENVNWAGVIHITALRDSPGIAQNPGHSGAGPRALIVEPDGEHLLVHNAGENSLTRVPLGELPGTSAFEYTAPLPIWLGWDPTPFLIRQGRIDFNRTDNSASRTSSCASCHVDGHVDGIAWDLSTYLDPEGTPGNALGFPLDEKGPLVTQSVRRLRETGPYHWRGERKGLRTFDATFVNLMRRDSGLGVNFNYLRRYMELLAPRPNPNQRADRQLRPDEAEGLALFSTLPVAGGLRCIDCHALPIGTVGAIVENGGGGLAPTTVVPSLREVGDKVGERHAAGELFGTRSELGVGLGHAGAYPDIESFLLQADGAAHAGEALDLTAEQAAKLARFLEALDTGMAPATMTQLTVRSSAIPGELTSLLAQAEQGNCDVVYRRGPVYTSGEVRYATGLYDPSTDTFRRPSIYLEPLALDELLAFADETPITFLGVPLWSGLPMGLDRDVDGILDLDEAQYGTSYENPDVDRDNFLDGYEILWGLDPFEHDEDSPDAQAPDWTGPAQLVYATQNAVKFEFATTEPARITLFVDGGPGVDRWPLAPRFDTLFSLTVGNLDPGTTHEIALDIIDMAGNTRRRSFQVSTLERVTPAPVGAAEIALEVTQQGGAEILTASVRLEVEGAAPAPGYVLRAAVYHESAAGPIEIDPQAEALLSSTAGTAVFEVPLPAGLPAGELVFVLRGVEAPPGEPFHAVGANAVSTARLAY